MNRSFEIIDHTADVGVVAYGASIEELFTNAALAVFSLITEPESVGDSVRLDVAVKSESRDGLLVDWLNELIYLFDVKHVLFSRFDIESLTETDIRAICYGESFDPMKHKIMAGVKAATYHMLQFTEEDEGYRAQIILDV